MRKILLILTLAVVLVISMVFITGPPVLALVPTVAAAAVCSAAKLSIVKRLEEKSPTPKVWCGIPGTLWTLLVSTRTVLRQHVIKIPLIIAAKLGSFIYVFTAASRSLTTRLNL